MRILTFNTWQERGPWRERWEVTFQGLQAFAPDLVGFQEVFNPDWAAEVQKRTRYTSLVFPRNPSGLMILSRFPVVREAGLVMKAQSPTEPYLRYVLMAVLECHGHPVAMFNTHLSWRIEEEDIREKQVAELIDFVEEEAGGIETIAVGDFNAPPKTPEIQAMVLRGKFVDTYAACHSKDAGLTWDNRNPYAASASGPMPDRRIDYIFVRNAGKALGRLKAAKVVLTQPGRGGIFASDHYGVLTEFEK